MPFGFASTCADAGRSLISRALGRFAAIFGTPLRDAHTGEPLGRAIVLGWGGAVYLIGLPVSVRPVVLAEPRLTFWRSRLGFTRYPRQPVYQSPAP